MALKIRSLGLTLLISAGVFVLGILVMNSVVMPLIIHQRNSVIVPDVRSTSEKQARRTIDRLSLRFQVDRREHSSEIPEGYVITQRPRANDTVKQGRTVSVILSLGPRTQRVPELKDLSLRQARLMLGQRGLQPGRVARVMIVGSARETVLACSPRSGREVEEDSEVSLLVGVGGMPKSYLMPDLLGQDLFFIRDKLESRGFRVSGVRYEPRADAYPNTIIDQVPKPGIMIREGDSIELVAAGSE